ncbi:hypothetical protein ACOMHN_049203 [Nucella lapillus]
MITTTIVISIIINSTIIIIIIIVITIIIIVIIVFTIIIIIIVIIIIITIVMENLVNSVLVFYIPVNGTALCPSARALTTHSKTGTKRGKGTTMSDSLGLCTANAMARGRRPAFR